MNNQDRIRSLVIEIAKLWFTNDGIDLEKQSTEDLLKMIKQAVAIQKESSRLSGVR